MIWFEWLIIPIALVIIISVLLQESSDTAVSAFTGESNDLFKNRKMRGPELFLNYATLISAILLVVLIIISASFGFRWEYNA
jgi:preprotein translocase subunit SecG